MTVQLQGNKYTLDLYAHSHQGESERTVGMNNDEGTPYNYMSWKGSGKVINTADRSETKFCFETEGRADYKGGIAFKRENYNFDQWNAPFEDFIFSTHFSTAKSSRNINICGKANWIDMIAEEIIAEDQISEIPVLEYVFKSKLLDTLIEKGIVAELQTNQILLALQ